MKLTASRTIVSIASNIASMVAACPDHSLTGLRRLRRQLSRELREEEPSTVIRVARHLVSTSGVPRWFAYELLNQHRAAVSALTWQDVEALGAGIATWGDVDAFGCYVAGPALRENRLSTTDVRRWSKSDDRWWRRAALVSTVPLNNTARGGQGDAKRTLAVCDYLRHDRDDMVVKAMSWALRELAKKEPERVAAYVSRHCDDLAPRVVREVRNKLRTGLKNPKSPARPLASQDNSQ
jgi:3-methyladenine DNA glycosylase AlkD